MLAMLNGAPQHARKCSKLLYDLQGEFCRLFPDFEKFEKSLQQVACPLSLVYEAALQELQLGEKKFSNIWQLAQKMPVLFGSTSVCELTFGVMNINKTRNRTQLTDEHLGCCLVNFHHKSGASFWCSGKKGWPATLCPLNPSIVSCLFIHSVH